MTTRELAIASLERYNTLFDVHPRPSYHTVVCPSSECILVVVDVDRQ